MSFEDDDYDRYWDAISDWEADVVRRGIAEQSYDNIRDYLATFGDAIEARVSRCITEAVELVAAGHSGPAVLLSVTAAELTIRYFILRPLLQGAFFSEEWAEILLSRVFRQRSHGDRLLLPAVVGAWDIDLAQLELDERHKLWQVFQSRVIPLRNEIIHQGASATTEQAKESIACAKAFLRNLVEPLAHRFGLSWPVRAWHIIEQGVGGAKFSTTCEQKDPFINVLR